MGKLSELNNSKTAGKTLRANTLAYKCYEGTPMTPAVMFLDCWKKPEYLERTYTLPVHIYAQGEHANFMQKHPRFPKCFIQILKKQIFRKCV